MSFFSHYDAAWRRAHVPQHLLGGVAHFLAQSAVVWLFRHGHETAALVAAVTYIQAIWERYQREVPEYNYPYWSMVGDTVLTTVGAAATAGLLQLF